MQAPPRVLFIDAYDSFSNNIISLLENELSVKVVKVFIDTPIADLSSFLRSFHAVVCGPGPGHPSIQHNVGLFADIWTLGDRDMIPVLGICLGFQSLALQFGGQVSQLARPRHGLVTDIISSQQSIFRGVPRARAVQYHSLHVSLGHDVAGGEREAIWKASAKASDLLPLAWDITGDFTGAEGTNPPAILMGVRHSYKPFFGVQFHPESICSENSARSVVWNWWEEVDSWWANNTRITSLSNRPRSEDLRPSKPHEPSSRASTISSRSSRDPSSSPPSTASSILSSHVSSFNHVVRDLGSLTVPRVCELLDVTSSEVIVLDSELRPMQNLGESSIIGLVEPDTIKLLYSVRTNYVTIETNGSKRQCSLAPYGDSIFTYLNEFLAARAIVEHPDNAFCGGLMGYVTYEAGLETIDVSTSSKGARPDICFAFVERSLVLDHVHGKIYIQSLKSEDNSNEENWISKTAKLLEAASAAGDRTTSIDAHTKINEAFQCEVPIEVDYCAKIRACQDEIRAGESYEICLTDQTTIQIESTAGDLQRPWQRYSTQRQLNRAPFAAYVRLGPLTLLSTSPERFLRWSRPALDPQRPAIDQCERISTCQFRPIKGTVRKWETAKDALPRLVTLEQATAILSTPKEQAENLMIVDLIRHDLHGVAGSGSVSVPALMVVEEYETVYQLVSVIEGRLPCPLLPGLPTQRPIGLSSSHPIYVDLDDEDVVERRHHSGIDVLAAALPPGSMTGAPKRRACRLLRGIEEEAPRSIYSGVVGYMCVTGKGDFSVVIRSAYRWDDEITDDQRGSVETWHLGAGGAITDLSTEEGEWEEMLTKLRGTLRSFAPSAEAAVFG